MSGRAVTSLDDINQLPVHGQYVLGWCTLHARVEDGAVAQPFDTIPAYDIRGHQRGQECWCMPRAEYADDTDEIVGYAHNAADMREHYAPHGTRKRS